MHPIQSTPDNLVVQYEFVETILPLLLPTQVKVYLALHTLPGSENRLVEGASVRKLAKTFEMSNSSVWKALKGLEHLRLIQRRTDGVILCSINEELLEQWASGDVIVGAYA